MKFSRSLILLGLLTAPAMAEPTIAAEAPEPIEYQVVVPASLAETWAQWTTPAGLESFFSREAIIEPEVMGEFSIHFFPHNPPGTRGAEGMRILAFEPEDRLVFTWNAPPNLPNARAQMAAVEVTFDALEGGETLVSLTHTLFGRTEEWHMTREYFAAAWQVVLTRNVYAVEFGPIDWDAPPEGLMYSPPSREELEARLIASP